MPENRLETLEALTQHGAKLDYINEKGNNFFHLFAMFLRDNKDKESIGTY